MRRACSGKCNIMCYKLLCNIICDYEVVWVNISNDNIRINGRWRMGISAVMYRDKSRHFAYTEPITTNGFIDGRVSTGLYQSAVPQRISIHQLLLSHSDHIRNNEQRSTKRPCLHISHTNHVIPILQRNLLNLTFAPRVTRTTDNRSQVHSTTETSRAHFSLSVPDKTVYNAPTNRFRQCIALWYQRP